MENRGTKKRAKPEPSEEEEEEVKEVKKVKNVKNEDPEWQVYMTELVDSIKSEQDSFPSTCPLSKVGTNIATGFLFPWCVIDNRINSKLYGDEPLTPEEKEQVNNRLRRMILVVQAFIQ